MTIKEIEAGLLSLPPTEKVGLLQLLFSDLIGAWPGIEKSSGVLGGDARITGTRIPVWTLEGYRRLGWSDAQILDNFPRLTAADLANAWSYVAANLEEIEASLRENDEEAAA
jgi:uncharacterized protein (DUF433 family)